MRKRLPKILVTGGAGFIGSAFIKLAIQQGYGVVVIDKLTYAGDLARLNEVTGKFKFYKLDIIDRARIEQLFKKEKPEILVNFAAESHVDRSILGSDDFVRTNIQGTQVLMDIAKKFRIVKFVHISTDEVYGDIEKGQFFENTAFNPSSPYSASKAAADLLVKSYIRTFKFPAVILRPSNNYGPWQYPEKFIPVVIYKALKNEKIPVYGRGQNIREWLHVYDCAKAVLKVIKKSDCGKAYNIGSGNERKNIDVARRILAILDKPVSLIEFVKDRPGHDFRYSLNYAKIRKDLDWQPQFSFDKGLVDTVLWYKNNFKWLESKMVYLRSYWSKVYKKA